MDRRVRSFILLLALVPTPGVAVARQASLPSPLRISDLIRIAAERRDEIAAARERSRAGEARPDIVSALPDPMLSPAIDHLPFMMDGADVSITIEQQFPLSSVRGHRRTAALADLDKLRAAVATTALDVAVDAITSYLMLLERRRVAALVDDQIAFARDVVAATNARYASGTAPQSDVLRAELEVARLDTRGRALVSEVRAAEAMLNTSLARDPGASVPDLEVPTLTAPVPAWPEIKRALSSRPELEAGRAEIARADADVLVMKDMYRPMATVRTGWASTMAEGSGWMAMVGISLPVWRGKLRAGVAEAEAMRAMATADLRAMTRMIEGEAATAAGELTAARERQSALRANVLPRARMAIEPAVAGYASGQLPLVSVIESVQALWQVESDLIAADIQLAVAWARLGRALGSYEAIIQ